MSDLRLTQRQTAERAIDLCETLHSMDSEEKHFGNHKTAHKDAMQKLQSRAARLRREIETGRIEEDRQMEFGDLIVLDAATDASQIPAEIPADDEQPTAPFGPGDEPFPDAEGIAVVANEYAEAQEDGYAACIAGLQVKSCPYEFSDAEQAHKRRAWIGGWNNAAGEAGDDEDEDLDATDESGNV
jgi:ribosome modulation factor